MRAAAPSAQPPGKRASRGSRAAVRLGARRPAARNLPCSTAAGAYGAAGVSASSAGIAGSRTCGAAPHPAARPRSQLDPEDLALLGLELGIREDALLVQLRELLQLGGVVGL